MIVAGDLQVVLQGRTVLDGVSFAVRRGEAVALVGANGSGKTTVLRCLLGLVPFSGRARIGGHDVVREPIAARGLTGYLPQRPAFGDLTAEEALRFVARLRRVPVEGVLPALRRVGLERYASSSARTFSGGMQQRLSLAAALLADPPVLLLDEPTASLDRAGQRSFLELAASLRDEGRTLLLASHRVEEIERLTSRVIELHEGRPLAKETGVVPLLRSFP